MSAETFARQSDVELINTFKIKGNDFTIQREELESENFEKPLSERMTVENEENQLILGTARFGESEQSEEGERDYEATVAVIEIGTTQIRCGFMGQSKPLETFPNIIGRPKDRKITNFMYKDQFVGDEAIDKEAEESLEIQYVTKGSVVQDWHGM